MQIQQHGSHCSFTLGGDDALLDERPAARALAESLGSTWYGIFADGDEFSAVWDRITWHMESPVPSTSVYGQWKVMEMARRMGIVVLQDGQGADEILGGYHKFFVASVMGLLRERSVGGIRMGFHMVRHLGSSPSLLNRGYRYARKLFRVPETREWLRPGLFAGEEGPAIDEAGLEMRVQDLERWSLPNLLTCEDRNSMAHSVETRLPFLDPEVVAISLAMPFDITHRHGWSKWPIRRVLDRAGVRGAAWRRGKLGFDVPQDKWMDGPLRSQVESFLQARHPLFDEFLKPEALRPFFDRWRKGHRPHAVRDVLFQLLALDRFFEVWFPRGASLGSSRNPP
jgi:asparagine synthase (glutamine-hydrolysing)